MMNKKTSSIKQPSSRPYPKAGKAKTESATRVAESVAAYSVATPAKAYKRQPSLPRRISGYLVPDEVWQFAVQNDLLAHLETAIRLVHECFATVNDVKLAYETDWEIENKNWIAIEIKTVGEIEDILAQYNRFTMQMVRQVPPDKGDKILLGF